MKKMLILGVIYSLLISCQLNKSYENEESMKKEAVKVAEGFYKNIQEKKNNDIDSFFSKGFFEVSSKDDLLSLLKKTHDLAGDYKSKVLVDWKTKRMVGANEASAYLLIYEVTYTNYNAIETIQLVKEDEEVKIFGYNVNSKAFLAQ